MLSEAAVRPRWRARRRTPIRAAEPVRLIAPVAVNGGTPEVQELQLAALAAAGAHVHVSGPEERADQPYMHARAAVVDGEIAYIGSISLSADSIAFNRERA